jgi:hypothetical protein
LEKYSSASLIETSVIVMNSRAVFVENQHYADEIQCEIHKNPVLKKQK